MRIIDFEQIRTLASGMTPLRWIEWVDYALRHKAEFIMPPKSRISQSNGDYYNIMPVLYEKENVAMLKMIGRHDIKRGESRSVMMGDMLLYEADSGILKAVVDAEYITTLRTGVVAAHSALLFARRDFSTVALLGLGNIMTVCFSAFITKLRADGDNRLLTVRLYQHHEQEVRFAKRFSDLSNVEFVFCDSYERLMSDSDIIISAVTKATQNFAPDVCYKSGVTVVPICTMGFQNCDLFFDKVFTDEIQQITGFKYFNSFKSVTNVTDVLNGVAFGRTNDLERILVYNYGIGIHDLYFAQQLCGMISSQEIDYDYCKEKYFV